jgi:hypothetical protein
VLSDLAIAGELPTEHCDTKSRQDNCDSLFHSFSIVFCRRNEKLGLTVNDGK